MVGSCGAPTRVEEEPSSGGSFPASVTLPVSARRVRRIMCSENNDVYLGDGCLTVSLNAPFIRKKCVGMVMQFGHFHRRM